MRLNLKTARLKKELSQRKLAEIIGVTRQAISKIESGQIKNGAVTTWDALEKALGVDQKILRQIDCYTKANNREKAKQ